MTNIDHDEAAQEVDAVDEIDTALDNKKEEVPYHPSDPVGGHAGAEAAKPSPHTAGTSGLVSQDALSKAVLAPKPSAMGLDHKGIVQAKDSLEAWRIAELFLKSKAIPKQFENVAQVFMARQYLQAHGLNPEIGIRQTTIINGTLSIWGDLPKAICERSGMVEDFVEILADKDYNEISFQNKNLAAQEWVAACTVKRKGKDPITRTFTVDEAKKAELWGKKDTWTKYPRRMLQMRARSLALKDAFPDVLSGIAINEYDYDTSIDNGAPRDVLPEGRKNVAHELNEKFIVDETEADQGQTSPSLN